MGTVLKRWEKGEREKEMKGRKEEVMKRSREKGMREGMGERTEGEGETREAERNLNCIMSHDDRQNQQNTVIVTLFKLFTVDSCIC